MQQVYRTWEAASSVAICFPIESFNVIQWKLFIFLVDVGNCKIITENVSAIFSSK